MVGGKYGMKLLKANTLQQLLGRFRLEAGALWSGDGGIYQQDIAECHTTDSVRAWFKEHQDQFIVLPCPENSPDLNPINNLWNHLDRVVRAMDPHARNLVQQ
ncbi:transposable element Tcb1 transposase [Trichonephila clavipes]|nr:transposable element Tcb1 transposase [Trichonephila clavipes]